MTDMAAGSARLNWLYLLIGSVLALAVPGFALATAAGPEQRALGLAVAPFGWHLLLAVHLVATLPLCLLAAALLRRLLPVWTALLWAALGLGTAWASQQAGLAVGHRLDQEQSGVAVRLAVRVLWCLSLQLPWCLFGMALRNRVVQVANLPNDGNSAGSLARVVQLVLTGVIAVAAPAVYTNHLIQLTTHKLDELRQGMPLPRMLVVVQGLCDLGSREDGTGEALPALRKQIREQVRALTLSAQRPLPWNAPAELRLQRAGVLAALDRLTEAETLLRPLAEANPNASLLLAAILKDQKRWRESSAYYRQTLKLLAGLPATQRDVHEARVQAYYYLAWNARQRQAHAEAEAIYLEAMQRLPQAKAYFHFHLGKHYHQTSQSLSAAEHLSRAAELDPSYRQQVGPLLQELSERTPACLLYRRN